MNNSGKGTEVDKSVQVVPVPPGWWYGYTRGWKQNRQLYKASKFSVHLGVFWWQCCCFWNSGNLPEADRWVFCLLHEFFLTDWNSLSRGISESQKQRLDKIKDAVTKFVSAGLDRQYSPKDPIRAWLSFMKRSDEAPGIHKKLLAEVSTMGEKPQLYSVNTWLGPMNYDPSRPYDLGVEEIAGEGNFADFDITNGLIPEVPPPRERRNSIDSNPTTQPVPIRNDGSHLETNRQHVTRPHPNFHNANGNLQQIQNVVSRLGQEQATWQERLNSMTQRGVNHITPSMFQNMATGIYNEVNANWNGQATNMGVNQPANMGMNQSTHMGMNQQTNVGMNHPANVGMNQHTMMGMDHHAMMRTDQHAFTKMGQNMSNGAIGFGSKETDQNANDENNHHTKGAADDGRTGKGFVKGGLIGRAMHSGSSQPLSPRHSSQASSSSTLKKPKGLSFEDTPPKKKPRLALEFSP